jgi:hypothetical protein
MTTLSDDGYWEFVDGQWAPTEKQLQSLMDGATPYDQESEIINQVKPILQPISAASLLTESEQEVLEIEILTGSEELAILVGSLCIFYGALDFLMWLIFGVWFPGPFFSPMVFGGIGSVIIHYSSFWNFIKLEPFSKSQNTKYILGGVLSSALFLILVIFLISIADDEIVGTWHNDAQTFTFNSDGTLEDSTGEWNEWRVDGDTLFLVDSSESEWEYMFRYSVSTEVLFLAPLDYDESVMSENCVIFVMKGVSFESAEYTSWPSWCPTE